MGLSTFARLALHFALALPAADALATPYATSPACCVVPGAGPGIPAPEEVPGKAFSDRLDRDATGAASPEQNVIWDGTGGTADGLSFDAALGGIPGGEVDALASPFDLLFAEVIANRSALLLSTAGSPDVQVEDLAGGAATWITAPEIDDTNPIRDLDGLEVWGAEGPSPLFDDALRYSLEGDPGPVGGPRVAVWEYDPFLNQSHIVYTVAAIATAVGLDALYWDAVDLDALMTLEERLLFSLDPIQAVTGAPLLDGGEIFVWDGSPGLSVATFLDHGGHLWDTAFDVRGAFGTPSENVDALEAVSVPEPRVALLLACAALFRLARRRRRAALALLVVASLGLTAAPIRAAETGAQISRAVLAGYDALLAALNELPEAERMPLAAFVADSKAQYRQYNQCTAMALLEQFMDGADALRPSGGTGLAERLRNRSWALRLAILATLPPSPCYDPRLARMPEVAIGESTDERFLARFDLGEAYLDTREEGGQTWTLVRVPGTSPRFEIGEGGPAVPYVHRLLAVPQGAEIQFTARPVAGRTFAMNLFPLQGQAAMSNHRPEDYPDGPPPDEVFDDPPFAFDADAYAVDALYPREPCKVELFGEARDLRIASVSCAVGQYNPVSDALTLFESIELEVGFVNGRGFRRDARHASPFENATGIPGIDSVLNDAAVARFPGDLAAFVPTCDGEELLIVTHEDLRAWADALAAHKQGIGIMTTVLEWNTVLPGTEPGEQEIVNFLTDRYASCAVRPSYLLLFGDAEYVPTWYWPNPLGAAVVIPSDYPYAFLWSDPDPDPLMDFAVGRLPVDPGHAQAVVDKIIQYESGPPGFGDPSSPFEFYETVSIASQFECCAISTEESEFLDGTDQRAFIPVVEEVRSHLVSQGFGVERIYTKTVDGSYTGDPTPLRNVWGDPLAPPLLPPFPWDGTTQDVVDAFEAGRFLAIHLDHGGPSGWSHPGFGGSTVSALTNGGELPFVLSYNCSTGYFDEETDGPPNDPTLDYPASYQSFAERIIRNPNGGAIGVVAATRTTYGHGNIMIKGTVDSAFPGMDPSFGSSLPRRRLGDMFNSGRSYMIDQYGWSEDTLRHLLLYNLHGDPTVWMWTEKPASIPEPPVLVEFNPFVLDVFFDVESVEITAWQEGAEGPIPIGRALVQNGVAHLEHVVAPVAGLPVQLAASGEGFVRTPLGSVPGPSAPPGSRGCASSLRVAMALVLVPLLWTAVARCAHRGALDTD